MIKTVIQLIPDRHGEKNRRRMTDMNAIINNESYYLGTIPLKESNVHNY